MHELADDLRFEEAHAKEKLTDTEFSQNRKSLATLITIWMSSRWKKARDQLYKLLTRGERCGNTGVYL